MRLRPPVLVSMLAAAIVAGLAAVPAAADAAPGAGAPGGAARALALPRGPAELSESTRLADRRALVVGTRFYAMGTADGLYPAAGFHTRGEMGGFWAPPIKVLDGLWFGVDGQWLGKQVRAERFTSGWGYTRIAYAASGGVRVERTDFVPDGMRAALVGLTFVSDADRALRLTMDAHSELMHVYPWGETKPSQLQYNLPDRGSVSSGALVFRERGAPPVPNAAWHDWVAMVGSTLTPRAARLGPDFRGPQDPAVTCPASGPGAPPQPPRCDDTAYGKGSGGRLHYSLALRSGESHTVWFAVAGSEHGPEAARATYRRALDNPLAALYRKIESREDLAARSVVDLPRNRLLQRSVEWYKQNLADSRQETRGLRLRAVRTGQAYPPPEGRVARARWYGAGWPDYPWIFGTDGEYTAFAAVAAGQFDTIKAHLRVLRDVSEIVNERSGKVVHEVMSDGSVFFGTNEEPGNTDETAKFPSAVALIWRWSGDDAFRDELYDFTRRNMRYIVNRLDADGDGWPEGLGNVERAGMGEEKLDNTVYTIRGLRDLADLARSKGDMATARWADWHAGALESRFEATWWFDRGTRQYADSIDEPNDTNPANDNTKIFQRHWIGLTPMDALLVRPGRVTRPLANNRHATIALEQRERNCYTGTYGLFHTGTGPTSAPGGNDGPACDRHVSEVLNEENIFSLNTAIMAVAEGNFGRLGRNQQRFYTDANARIQLDRSIWEMPGASPEVAPSPDFGANIDRLFTERSSVLQAWGAYGVLWPVVAQQLGVNPDVGRGRLEVVPQVPGGQPYVAGRNIRLGSGSVDVRAERASDRLETTVTHRLDAHLTIGAVLPTGARVAGVDLDGHRADYRLRTGARGTEVLVPAPDGRLVSTLVVHLRH